MTAAIYSTSAFVVAFLFLKEVCPLGFSVRCLEHVITQTLPSIINRPLPSLDRRPYCSQVDSNTPSTVTERSPLIPAPKIKTKHNSLRKLLTPRVLTVMVNYAFLALTDMAFVVLLPVFLSTPIAKGGLGMTPSLVGICLGGYGIANGVVSIFFFVPVNRRFGARAILGSCHAIYIMCYASFPVMNKLARDQQLEGLSMSIWIVLTMQLALATSQSMAFSKSLSIFR